MGTVDLSANTAAYSETPAPLGRPGGPGLWRTKGLKLPDYIENVTKGIMKGGVPDESRAIALAIGAVKRWASGGGKVSPEVRAAAAKALAEWEALKASHSGGSSHANEAITAVDLAGYLPPHVPAGSANGGQFGTTSGGGSSTPSPAQAHAAHTAHVAHLQHLVATGKATPAQRAELAGLRKAGPPTAPSALVAAAKTAALAAAKAKVASAAASKKPAAVKKATAVKKPAAVKPKVVKPKAPKVKATPGHPVVNKKKGTVTAVVNGKQVTMRLHEWHVIHVAHQQAVARQKAMKAGVKFAGDGAAIELVGPGGWSHGWIKVGPGSGDVHTVNVEAFENSQVKSSLMSAKTLADAGHYTAAADHLTVAARHAKATHTQKQILGARNALLARAKRTQTHAGGDSDRWLDLAFTEALAERVPPGRPEGGRFTPVAAQLGRYDTPEQAAKVINALEPGQRAMVRTTTLPPPGFCWQEHDRLTVA